MRLQMLKVVSPRQGQRVSLPAVLRRMDSHAAVLLEQERSTHGGAANGRDGPAKAPELMSPEEIDLLIANLSEVRKIDV